MVRTGRSFRTHRILQVVGVLIVWLAGSLVFASDSWWIRRDEGWFFYNERKPVKKERKVQDQKPKAEEKKAEEKKLFTERMQQKGQELLSAAIENPTEENVERFMRFNKAMLVLADNFAKVWQKVLMKNPDLLFPGSLSYSFRDIEEAIGRLKETAGLFFFYSTECDLCREQAVQLREFEQKHGMVVFPITLDGGILPEYPNTVRDNGISVRVGLRRTPSIYLAFPREGRIELIAEGFIDTFDLERRLYYYAQPVEDIQAVLRHFIGGDGSGSSR